MKKKTELQKARLLYLLGFSQRAIGKWFGKSRTWVYDKVKDIPEEERFDVGLTINDNKINEKISKYIK